MDRLLKVLGFTGVGNSQNSVASRTPFSHNGESKSSTTAKSILFSTLPFQVRRRIWLLLAGPYLSPSKGLYWSPIADCDSHEVKINETTPANSTRHSLLLQICRETRAIAIELYRRIDPRSAALVRLDIDNLNFYKTYSIQKLFDDIADDPCEKHPGDQSQDSYISHGILIASKSEILHNVRHLTIRGPLGSDLKILAQFSRLQTCTFVTIKREYFSLLGSDSTNKSVVTEWDKIFSDWPKPPQLLFLDRIDHKRGLALHRNQEGKWQWILHDLDGDEVVEGFRFFERDLALGMFSNGFQ